MDFNEAQQRFTSLKQQLAVKQITAEEFSAQMALIRLQDGSGSWWQLGEDGQWLFWNGASWEARVPPIATHPQSPIGLQPQQVAQTAQEGQSSPKTLFQLISMLIPAMIKCWFKMIPLMVVLSILTFAVHTFSMVYLNEGFNLNSSNPLLSMMLVLKGNFVTGMLFWTFLSAIGTSLLIQLYQSGFSKVKSDISMIPSWVNECLRGSGTVSKPLVLGCAAASLLMGTIVDNRLVSLQLCVMMIMSLMSRQKGLMSTIIPLAWSDANRLFGRRQGTVFNHLWIGVCLWGVIVGFGLAVILPYATFLGVIGTIVLLGLAVKTFYDQKNRPSGGVFLFLPFMTILFAWAAKKAYADDGGWSETGTTPTFLGWLKSPGAVTAIGIGVPPAVAVNVGGAAGAMIETEPYKPATIFGTGTKEDPFRDKYAYKVNPDGSLSGYAETTDIPIAGAGTSDDPYRNVNQGESPEPEDTEDTKETKDTEETEDTKETKDTEETKETKDTEDTEETEDTKDTEDTEETKDTEKTEETEDTKDTKDTDETEKPNEPPKQFVPFGKEDMDPEIPGIENDPDADMFTTPVPSKDHDQIASNIIQHIDPGTLEEFTTKDWNATSDTDKKVLTDRIAKEIATNYGIGSPPPIVWTSSPPPDLTGAAGWYDPGDPSDPSKPPQIYINSNHSMANCPSGVVSLIAHEMKHAQQFDTNNPMESKTARDITNTNTAPGKYQVATVDYNRYKKQYIERDANSMGKALSDVVSKGAYSIKLEKLINVIKDLQPDSPSPAPYTNVDQIKQDPQGYKKYLVNNPDEKAKFVEYMAKHPDKLTQFKQMIRQNHAK